MATELELDHCFWNAFCNDGDFQKWFLSKSKYAGRSLELKTDELWHQRWYKDPETKKDSETDITLIFRDLDSGELVSIHIENKGAHRAWEIGQAEGYRRRASNRMLKWKHVDYEVVLLAPASHIATHPIEASHFDFCVSYEDVARYAAEFSDACS